MKHKQWTLDAKVGDRVSFQGAELEPTETIDTTVSQHLKMRAVEWSVYPQLEFLSSSELDESRWEALGELL